MSEHRYDDAAAAYRELLKSRPDEPGLLANLGMALSMGGHEAEAVAPLGLRACHLVALAHLSDHGPSPQQTLSEALGLDASNLVALLNELEDADLIVRRRDRADRRRGIIELSAEGERVLATVDRVFEAVDDEMLAALSADERAVLNELLARATARLCERHAVCDAVEAAEECDPPDC